MTFLSKSYNIENKVAVISGGGGILAGEMAKGFLQAGSHVVLLDINQDNLEKAVNEMRKISPNVSGLACNVLDQGNLESIHQTILEQHGRIDILVNAAGGNMSGATINPDQNFFDLDINQFKKVTDLNLNGTVLPTLVFGKTMAKQKAGSIINVSSMASYRAITRVVGYSAAKAAIDNFTRWLAVEMAGKFGSGVRVNAIAPGFLITNQNRALLTNADGSLTERGHKIIAITPFGRFGEPEEMVGPVLWLAGDASRFVTGAVIPVDGGFSSFSGV